MMLQPTTSAYRTRLLAAQGSNVNSIGGFALRLTAGGAVSDHSSGKALDVFQKGGLRSQQGILIAEWALTQPDTGYVIWDNYIISANTGWNWCPYTQCGGATGKKNQSSPTGRHEDHVHISVYPGSRPRYAPHPNRGGATRRPEGVDLSRYGTDNNDVARRREAFLQTIAFAEGTEKQVDNGYRTLVGFGLFSSYADHPRKLIRLSSTLSSTAAGRYQILERTWDATRKLLKLPDFSPKSQDLAAIQLIKQRGALDEVDRGRPDAAILLCNREWASFPGSPYGQGTKTMQAMLDAYKRSYGDGILGEVDSDDHAGYYDEITGEFIQGDVDFEIAKLQKFLEVQANGKFDKATFEALKKKLIEVGRSDLDIVINGQTVGALGLRWVP